MFAGRLTKAETEIFFFETLFELFEDKVQANLKPFFGSGTKWKRR
jgi:hypothetical protein